MIQRYTFKGNDAQTAFIPDHNDFEQSQVLFNIRNEQTQELIPIMMSPADAKRLAEAILPRSTKKKSKLFNFIQI